VGVSSFSFLIHYTEQYAVNEHCRKVCKPTDQSTPSWLIFFLKSAANACFAGIMLLQKVCKPFWGIVAKGKFLIFHTVPVRKRPCSGHLFLKQI